MKKTSLPFPLFLALTYLRPKRSFASVIPVITTCGVMLGVAILMIVLAVMTGFGDVWREKILSFKPHITIYHRGGVIDNPEAVCKIAEAVPGVRAAAPAILFPAMVRTDYADPRTVTVLGIDPERTLLFEQLRDKMTYGKFSVDEDWAVMGEDLALSLRLRAGEKMLCYSPLNLSSSDSLYLPEEVKLAGVYNLGMRDFDDGIFLCSLGMAQALLGMDGGARMIQVQTENPEQVWTQCAQISEQLGSDYIVNSWQDEDRVLFDALRTEKTMMFILLAFIAVVAAFCVTNTLIVITIQKTREIGLLKALGFSAGKIKGAFVLNGLIQCVAGEALGIGLGALVLHNLQRMVKLLASCGIEVFPKEIYGLAEIPWRIVGSDVFAVAATVFLFCTAASFLPAWLASRLDPVRAINQE